MRIGGRPFMEEAVTFAPLKTSVKGGVRRTGGLHAVRDSVEKTKISCLHLPAHSPISSLPHGKGGYIRGFPGGRCSGRHGRKTRLPYARVRMQQARIMKILPVSGRAPGEVRREGRPAINSVGFVQKSLLCQIFLKIHSSANSVVLVALRGTA